MKILINSIPRALAETSKVCSSVNIGSTKTGINMTAVRDMGRIIKETSDASDMGPAKLVVFTNAVEDNLLWPSAFMVWVKRMWSSMSGSLVLVVKRALEKFPEPTLMCSRNRQNSL